MNDEPLNAPPRPITEASKLAHDLNNLWNLVGALAELMRLQSPKDPLVASYSKEFQDVAKKGAKLLRPAMRYNTSEPAATLDLSRFTEEMRFPIKVLAGDGIFLAMNLNSRDRVRIDPLACEQILLNLVTNARDAMPDGGTLHIEITDFIVDEPIPAWPIPVAPGRYVRMQVRDTGVGMDAEVARCCFDPHFSTKHPERGAGLGLAIVRDYVASSNGGITVFSTPGLGSWFTLYFPVID